jgi:hypothetical protein
LLLAAGPAGALQLGWEAGRISHDSVERLPDGREFNRDTGTLDTATLFLRWPLQSPASAAPGSVPRWQGGLGWRHEDGRLAYRGLSSAGLPLVSGTRLARERLSLGLERRFGPLGDAPNAGSAALGLELATEWTDRRIAATPLSVALHERLTRHTLALHARASQPLGRSGFRVLARWHEARAWSQHLRAEAGSTLDAVQLRPRGGHGREWGLGLGYAPAGASWQLQLVHAARRERVGDSAAVAATAAGRPVGSVRYPGSHNRGRGWQLGWQLRLD